jgi:hypothetical protein
LEFDATTAPKGKHGGEPHRKERGAAGAAYDCGVPQGSPRTPGTPGFPYILEGFPTFL